MVGNPGFYSARRRPKESYDRCGLARRMWTVGDDDSAALSTNENPLFYPRVVSFAAVIPRGSQALPCLSTCGDFQLGADVIGDFG
jgi:hypothetical protein